MATAGLALCAAALVACGNSGPAGDGADAAPPTDGATDGGRPDAGGTASACPTGPAGLHCLIDLLDEVAATCDPGRLEELRASLTARHGDLPAWYEGRALFVTYGGSAAIAGDFDGWSTTALATEELCGSELFTASVSIPTGFYAYKLVYSGSWKLDPENWAFAYDDFAGNADGANSVLDTYDSGRGHLVQPDIDICSDELGNCRRYITYLPPGYGAPDAADRHYPVLFMHDAQNIYDDHDCCFGHTGWEVNIQLDTDIAAGVVEPVVVVGFPHGGDARTDEYGNTIDNGGKQETFMAFQVGTVQPRAAELWRIDLDRAYVAGSSLGGLLSFRLAFAYPDVYAGAASLSGSYWLGEGTGEAMSDFVEPDRLHQRAAIPGPRRHRGRRRRQLPVQRRPARPARGRRVDAQRLARLHAGAGSAVLLPRRRRHPQRAVVARPGVPLLALLLRRLPVAATATPRWAGRRTAPARRCS